MYTLKVKNNRGDELELTSSPDYTVYKIEGLDTPEANINTSVNTTKNGSKVNSAKLESRNIVIYVKPERNIEQSRLNLYKYFPSLQTVTLYFSHGSRDVNIAGVVEYVRCDHFANPQVAQISILCPDPFFKDAQGLISRFSNVTPLFEFPFSIPSVGVEISRITTHNRKSIINPSNIETDVTITLFATGTVVNPIIYDITTGTEMHLNITMQQSDTIVIESNADKKNITLIRSGKTSNALGYMRPDSKWFSLLPGDNVFTYECESGSNNLQITFTASVLYSGV